MTPKSMDQPVVEITLSKGYTAFIDAEDAERVSTLSWHAYFNPRGRKTPRIYGYAYLRGSGLKNLKKVFLHRFILNAPKHLQVDHKNNNGLDNRKSNLRLATKSQNQCNARRKENKNGFRGVTKCNNPNYPFYARVNVGNQKTYVGSFRTAEEAARAYDEKAKELHGEFAVLNFPEVD